MPPARVVAVAPGSPAASTGIQPGDEVLALNGEAARDVRPAEGPKEAADAQGDGARIARRWRSLTPSLPARSSSVAPSSAPSRLR